MRTTLLRSTGVPTCQLTTGSSVNGEPAFTLGNAAMRSATTIPGAVTRANTVKPPFCASRFAELLPMLMNHWLVALLGSPPSLAMATVPRTFGRVVLNSLVTVPRDVTDWIGPTSGHRNPPDWMTNGTGVTVAARHCGGKTHRCSRHLGHRPGSLQPSTALRRPAGSCRRYPSWFAAAPWCFVRWQRW